MTNDILARIKQKPKILIVDDRESERMILTRILSKFDVDLHTASSGQEALSKLIRDDYILILLDVHMPMMDGIETAKYVRSNPGTENTPIIFLTAFDKDQINISRGYEAGAIDYLIKPIDEDILLSKVKNFIRSYSFEKEKEYEKILAELEKQNQQLKKAMEEANEARAAAEESQRRIERQTEELIKYTKELEQFAYVATHDLRVPIQNLEGILRQFRKRGYVNTDNRSTIDKMDASVERINTTLHDLSQVAAYKKSFGAEVKHIDIAHLFNNIIQDLEVQINDAHAEIFSDFSKAPEVSYLPAHLRSILQNLLSNAITYHSPQRKPFISVSSEKQQDYVCITVKDNGIGIAEKDKEKVFALFKRVATNVQGKGVGLYVTKAQLESQGGAIDFTSKPGEGTEFTVYLKNLKRTPAA